MVAQLLLQRAFAETVATGRAGKPGPLADTWPEARITVKRIGVSAIVLAGSNGQALAFGPGHVERTAQAGEWGIAVFAARRDTHFRFLKDVAVGDEIEITRRHGKTFRYRARRRLDRALRSIRHRSVHEWQGACPHHLLAVRCHRARADALRAACDDDFPGKVRRPRRPAIMIRAVLLRHAVPVVGPVERDDGRAARRRSRP